MDQVLLQLFQVFETRNSNSAGGHMYVYSVFSITLSGAAMFTGLYCFQAAPDTQQLPGRARNGAIHGALLGRQIYGTG